MISTPKPRETAWLWLAKQASGVLVFALVMVHLYANHMVAAGSLKNYSEVVAYLSNPWIAGLEVTFLVVVVSHSLLGSRSILLDLHPAPWLLRIVDWAFPVFGLGAMAYGIWLVRAVLAHGS